MHLKKLKGLTKSEQLQEWIAHWRKEEATWTKIAEADPTDAGAIERAQEATKLKDKNLASLRELVDNQPIAHIK